MTPSRKRGRIRLTLGSLSRNAIPVALVDFLFPSLAKDIREIKAAIKTIQMTQQEAAEQLQAVAAQQQKSIGEIDALQTESTAQGQRIKDLEAIINAGGEVSPGLATALAAVVAGQQAVDDKIPDAPAPVTLPEA